MKKNKNKNNVGSEGVNKGMIDYLLLSDAEKQMFVSNLSGIIVLGVGALLSVFLTKFSAYVPYLIFIIVIFNLSVQYFINKVNINIKELKMETDLKVQQLFVVIKSIRVFVTAVIGIKAILLLL